MSSIPILLAYPSSSSNPLPTKGSYATIHGASSGTNTLVA